MCLTMASLLLHSLTTDLLALHGMLVTLLLPAAG